MWFILTLLLAFLAPTAAWAQAEIVSSCGNTGLTLQLGTTVPLQMDLTGHLCTNAQAGGGSGTTAVTQAGPWFMGQAGIWNMRLQDGSGNAIGSLSGALNINLASSNAVVTVSPTGTFTTSDLHFPATQALGDAISNPTVTGVGAYMMLWDSTNSVMRRAQATAGTGQLQVAFTGPAFGVAFPSTGFAVGFRNGSGNLDYVTVDSSHNLQISCGGNPCNATDEAAFTVNSSGFSVIGGLFQTTATSNPLSTGTAGAAQLTTYRALMVNQRDSTGAELTDTTNHMVLTEAYTTNNASYQPHVCTTSPARAHITTATDTQLIAASGSKNIYICDFEFSAAGAVNFYFEKSSTGTCGSPTQIGILWTLAANEAKANMKPIYSGFNTGTSQQLCVNTSSTGGLDVAVYYDQY